MKKDLLILADKALVFVLCAVAILLAMAAIHLDINMFSGKLSELSFTELSQELLLVIMVALYACHAVKNSEMRPAFVLVAGFFACMLLRELDSWFGMAGLHWLPPVVLTAGLCIFYAAKRPRKTLRGLVRFTETQPFALIMSGLLTILVFSRLFGMKAIWIGMMGEDFSYLVKTFAEEGVELFGYVQCFLGSAFYTQLEWRKKRAYSEAPPALLVSEATERITS